MRFTGIRSWLSLWHSEIIESERRVMVLVVALACLLVSVSIGYVYAREIWVSGWQLWTWLITVFIILSTLLSGAGRPKLTASHRWRWLGLLILAAFLVRALLLETIPGGLHVDEAGIADFSLRHVFSLPNQTVNPFRTGPASQPSLYHYLVRLSLALAGESITGLRILSVLAGTLAVAVTYAMVCVFNNQRTAFISAFLMAGYHFHVHWSRIGLNNIWDTVWVPLMLVAFAWGWNKHWRGGAVISGLAVGLSQYFYAGSKLGIILLLFIIWQYWRRVEDKRRLVTYSAIMALTAACVAAPLVLFALKDPSPYFERSSVVFGWKPEWIAIVTGGSPNYLAFAWFQLWRSAGAFIAVPDVTGFYGPGVPLLFGVAAPLFVVGLFWALYRRLYLPVLWIILTVVFGGFLLSDPPGSSHYVVAIPAICWLVAIPLDWLLENGHPRLAIGLLLVVVLSDLYFYFGSYVPGEPRDLIHAFPLVPPT
jgi:hypothetical protein